MKSHNDNPGLQCPIPISEYPFIIAGHGSGGKLTHQLIDRLFKTAFAELGLQAEHDGAIVEKPNGKIVMTTDSFVVNPLFFPGGDIGMLAVNGTVNDLAMCGARPLYLSAGFILEEGLPMETLWKIALSMSRAASLAEVKIVTGDTKVVDKGKGDGVYINTAGIGELTGDIKISPEAVKPGDAVILNGDIGRHAVAVLSQRENLSFETAIESDCAPLGEVVMALIEAGIRLHCLRDLTRGGLATSLVEIAKAAKLSIEIDEIAVPVSGEVNAACEILGFDPLYLANEGRFVAFIPEPDVEKAYNIMMKFTDNNPPAIIGHVGHDSNGLVSAKSGIGSERIIDMLSGDQFPRIC